MAYLLTPTTELEAVNEMLYTIGESPVSTLEDNGVVDAITALSVLRAISREVQSMGWHFNTEPNRLLSPSYPDGYIILPDNTLRVDTTGRDANIDVTQRGFRLYDRDNNSYKFDRALTLELVVGLGFEEIPESARRYITIRAARIFQARVLGSETLSKFSESDELITLSNLKDAEAQTADYTLLDDWPVARVLQR